MTITKEKIVFAASVLLALASASGVRVPRVEPAPAVPAEEAPHPPRVTVPVPSLRPERPLDSSARDPFVPQSAWVASSPALLGLPPALPAGRALPGGAPPGIKAPLVLVPEDPRPVDEAQAPSPDPDAGGNK